MRMQDGFKQYLFCKQCEDIFGKDEKSFSEEVFKPYVNEELDDWGSATSKIKAFTHEEWLLRFVIGLQFRHLLMVDEKFVEKVGKSRYDKLRINQEIWRQYLLGERQDTGAQNRSYMILLQNLAFASGNFPPGLSPKVNSYILRATDADVTFSKDGKMGVYSKIGPIALFTTIVPKQVRGLGKAVIKKQGAFPVVQHLDDKSGILHFIMVDRPKEAMDKIDISEKQRKKIDDAYKKNEDRMDTHSVKAQISDQILADSLDANGFDESAG